VDYLEYSSEYYSTAQLQYPLYSTPYPNPEEADRYAAIVRYLSDTRLHYDKLEIVPRILDVGCGRGWLTNLMNPFGICEGIEPAQGAVELAQRHYPQLTFHLGTLTDLLDRGEFKPYHVVVSSEVIEHVPDRYKDEFVQQTARALVPGGFCIVTTPRGELYKPWWKSGTPRQPVEEWLTEKELRSLFELYGFRAIHHTRAHSVRFFRLNRVLSNSRYRRALEAVGLGFVIPALEYLRQFYQIWWFRAKS
jgi:SAM-dependent methyltransferase